MIKNYYCILLKKNPLILFFPFLILYSILVLISPTNGSMGDEGRYLLFAQNLLNGFYSRPSPDINLWNGPGYPILLIPFVALRLPLICITLLNAVLYYLSIILLFKTLKQFVSSNIAFIFSIFWACYYIAYEELIIIYSEVFSSFLISLLLFCLVKAFDLGNISKKYAIFSGLIMGYIVITKVIFGYVILIMFFGIGLLWLFNRKSLNFQRGFLIMVISLFSISPYLIYTYNLTNKVYYLSNSGGMSLYWMSTPFENEFGDWFHEREVTQSNTLDTNIDSVSNIIPGRNNYLYLNHAMDYKELDKYVGVERDETYKRIAINNIKQHPIKYFKNCISNIERLFFSIPYSYTLQRNNLRLPLTGILVVGISFSFFLTLINWRKLYFPIRFILFFILFYLGLTILVSTYTRMLTIIVPLLLFWIAIIFQRSIKINLFFDKEVKPGESQPSK